MGRISDAWDGLGKREQMLAVVAVAVLVLVVAAFLLFGGGDPVAPVDASTSTSEAVPDPNEPKPEGLVIDDQSPLTSVPGTTVAAMPEPGAGVAALSVTGGGEGDATGGAQTTPYNEGVPPVPEVVDPRRYTPPVVSDAIKAAGRDLERVGAAYTTCMEKAAAANADSRHCVNDALKYGVEISKGGLHRNGGLTLAKRSSDGHTVYLTFINGGECRSLDDGESCDAWTT